MRGGKGMCGEGVCVCVDGVCLACPCHVRVMS